MWKMGMTGLEEKSVLFIFVLYYLTVTQGLTYSRHSNDSTIPICIASI